MHFRYLVLASSGRKSSSCTEEQVCSRCSVLAAHARCWKLFVVGAASSLHTLTTMSSHLFETYLRRSGDASHYYRHLSCSAKRGRSAATAVVVGAASSLHTPATMSSHRSEACLRRSEDASHYYRYPADSAKRGRFALLQIPFMLSEAGTLRTTTACLVYALIRH